MSIIYKNKQINGVFYKNIECNKVYLNNKLIFENMPIGAVKIYGDGEKYRGYVPPVNASNIDEYRKIKHLNDKNTVSKVTNICGAKIDEIIPTNWESYTKSEGAFSGFGGPAYDSPSVLWQQFEFELKEGYNSITKEPYKNQYTITFYSMFDGDSYFYCANLIFYSEELTNIIKANTIQPYLQFK